MATTKCAAAAAAVLLLCFAAVALAEPRKGADRKGKLFNVFQVVRFNNDACDASNNRNGTCYPAEECEDRGGNNGGTCAGGFGVCCTFVEGCGSTTRENSTYFEVTGAADGSCAMSVCPCNSNICQLRLDFQQFTIAGPSTASDAFLKQLNGQAAKGGKKVATNTICLTDIFSVTNPGGNVPPSICGQNANEHMYVDASENCNNLQFQLGNAATAVSRTWSIKVTQYACDYENLAPSGCTQYYWGASTNTVQTYNFAGGHHLANQNQAICVRRERGNCRICWSPTALTDYDVSGPTPAIATPTAITNPDACCNYGTDAMNIKGFDCIIIPNAKDTAGVQKVSRRCGRSRFAATAATTEQTVCSNQVPFLLRFVSDGFENVGAIKESGDADVGLRAGYFMDAINC